MRWVENKVSYNILLLRQNWAFYYLGCSEVLHVEVTRVKRLQKQILLYAHRLKDIKVIPELEKQSLITCFKPINNNVLCGEFLVLFQGS